jgi:hypothetical protein
MNRNEKQIMAYFGWTLPVQPLQQDHCTMTENKFKTTTKPQFPKEYKQVNVPNRSEV